MQPHEGANPGAAPEQVETEVTDLIEGAVNTISGIEDLRSTSIEGLSQVNISFDLAKDVDVAAQEVRDKLNSVLAELPDTAETPIVQKLDPDTAECRMEVRCFCLRHSALRLRISAAS